MHFPSGEALLQQRKVLYMPVATTERTKQMSGQVGVIQCLVMPVNSKQ